MTTADLIANLSQLAARVEELESRSCRCSSCREIERELSRRKIVEKYAAILALAPADRAVAIEALGSARRSYFDAIGHEVVRVALDAPDVETRERWCAEIGAIYRDQIDIEFVHPPHRVKIRPASEAFGWTRAVFDISKESVRRLREVGLGGRVEGSAFRPIEWAPLPGYFEVMTADQLAVLRSIDPAFGSRIDSGHLVVSDFTPEQDRAALLEEWRLIDRSARKPLPMREGK